MSEKVSSIIEYIDEYFQSSARPNLIPYLVAKSNHEYYQLDITQTPDGNEVLEQLVGNYANRLTRMLDGHEILDWEEEGVENCLYCKPFLADENAFFQGLRTYTELNKNNFLRRNYPIRFFNIAIPLSATRFIHLFQYVRGSYHTKWKAHLNIFADRNIFQIVDYTRGINITRDFHFCCYYDNTSIRNSFSIVHKREHFERMFNYIEKYKQAFSDVSDFEFLDLTEISDGTEITWRQCHSLLNFPNLKQCLVAFQSELLSGQQTLSKEALDAKEIEYEIKNGIPVVKPRNLKQTQAVIKMLRDGLVETNYLKRKGIVGYVDVV